MRGRPPLHPAPTDRGPVFRRYSNRRYYSIDEKSYVTSSALLEHRRLVVLDARTGKDITRWAVAAAELERERKKLDALAVKMGFQP